MRLMRILGIVVRRKRIIGQTLLLVILVVVAGSYLATPTYKSSSKILITKTEKRHVAAESGRPRSEVLVTSHDIDVNKVLAVSRPYIDEMVCKLQLRDGQGNLMKACQMTRDGIFTAIKERLFPEPRIGISRYQATDVLEITATSLEAEQAMLMANTLAEIMVDRNQAQVRAEYRNAKDFLESQIRNIRKDYNTGLHEMADFKKQHQTVDLKTETRLVAENLAELLKEKQDNVISLAQARAKLRSLKDYLEKQSPEFVSTSTLKENPHIKVLKKNLTELRLQFAQATSELTERHPQVQAMKQRMNKAELELKSEIEVYRSSAPGLVALNGEIRALEARLEATNVQIDKELQSIEGLPDRASEQANLDMELKAMPKVYSSLLDSLYQNGMAEATTLSEIRVIESAVKPLSPAWPNKTANAAAGVIIGLVFGLGVAFIKEYLSDTIRTAEDVRELRPIAFMGAVPRLQGKEFPLISAKDPNDPLYESYRRIRTHIDVVDHMRERPLKSLLITSPGPREGRSTTAANLGICFAREGKRVAVIDLDVRRASLHTYFDVPNDVGLSDLFQGQVTVDEAIQPTRIKDLSIMPSGPPFPDPGGIIESDNMGQLLSGLEKRFDLVILDSAPLLVKSDALVLARHVDGLIIVLESEKTTRRAAYEMVDSLIKAEIRPLGFVLNGFSFKRGSYFYQQYYHGQCGRALIEEAKRV
jgi:succinoglycan biosynthesis transport protein ExoP